jgi:GR25 family glycosyltransferase involved in LPS biosynthesis
MNREIESLTTILENTKDSQVIEYCAQKLSDCYRDNKSSQALIVLINALCKLGRNSECLELIDNSSDPVYYRSIYYFSCMDYDLLIQHVKKFGITHRVLQLLMLSVKQTIEMNNKLLAYDIYNQLLKVEDHINTTNLKYNFQEVKRHFNNELSIIIPCMNRAERLTNCVESWRKSKFVSEIIVVDYSSDKPIKLSDDIKVIRVEGEKYFNLSRACNIGFDFASKNVVAKIDVDYMLRDDGFIEDLLCRNTQSFIAKGSHISSGSLSGFLMITKDLFLNYREDIFNWGYEEIDLHSRIVNKYPNVNMITLYDLHRYVYHEPHTTAKRFENYIKKDLRQTNTNNAQISNSGINKKAPRLEYKQLNKNTISLNHKKIDKIFCINLDKREDRMLDMCKIPNLTRFSAVDATNIIDLEKEYNVALLPANISSKIYFHVHKNAIGAYLSHMKVWQEVIKSDHEYSLVLEDDVDVQSVCDFLEGDFVPDDYELINLSKRIGNVDSSEVIYWGAESYVITKTAAKKLLHITDNPYILRYVLPAQLSKIQDMLNNKIIKDDLKLSSFPAISYAVDAFMSYCTRKEVKSPQRVKNLEYPCIDLNQEQCIISDINSTKPVWELDEDELLDIIKCI